MNQWPSNILTSTSGRTELPITGKEKIGEKLVWSVGQSQEFSLGCGELQMPIQHPCGRAQETSGWKTLMQPMGTGAFQSDITS